MSLSILAAHTRAVPVFAGVRRVVLAVVAVVLLAAVAVPGIALGAQTRLETSTFDGSGSDAGAFTGLGRIAAGQLSGSVYAIDVTAGVVDKFDAAGAAQDFSALGSSSLDGNAVTAPDGPVTFSFGADPDVAVDNSGTASDGNLIVVSDNQQTAWVFDSTGTYLHQITGFGYPCGAAVDSAGDVWISDLYAGAVIEYTSGGVATGTTVDTSAQGNPCHVALDSADNLYVANNNGSVEKYDASGAHVAQLDSAAAAAVAVDRTTDHVYVVHAGKVSVYDATGAKLYDFAKGISGAFLSGVAVNEAANEVHVADAGNNTVRVFGSPVTVAGATTAPASALQMTSATLNGSVDPGGVAVTDCRFEYTDEDDFQANGFTGASTVPCVPDSASIPADLGEHPVSAEIGGLDTARAYRFRLVIANADGTTAGDAVSLTTRGARINGEMTQAVGPDSATVTAQVNPNGENTTYHVEYGADTAYGQSTAESSSIGSDITDHPVGPTLTGLAEGTTYHWRLVVTSAAGAVNGADRSFTTQTITVAAPQSCANARFRTDRGIGLPDCRAYEQATPMAKNGNNPSGGINHVAASATGDAITFVVVGGIPGGVGAQNYPSYLARRGADAWSSAGIFPPLSYGQNAQVSGWTRDMGTVFDSATNTGTRASAFLGRDSDDGSITTILPHTAAAGTFNSRIAYAGASDDGSKVFFEVVGAVTPDAIANRDNLYAWDRATGVLSLAGVLPDGTTPAGGSFAGTYDLVNDSVDQGGARVQIYTQDLNAVSDDGGEVFFTAAGTGQLYVRKDATGPSASTVQLSASRKTNGAGPGGSDSNGPRPAAFMVATPDGSRALFTSSEELTDDANTGPSGEGNDLYAYDVATDELTDIAPDSDDPNGADVQGVIGISDDGSYVYLAANGVLADGATEGDCSGFSSSNFQGACNLYVWHDGAFKFITRLTVSTQTGAISDALNWMISTRYLTGRESTGRVTPDGRTLLFQSQRRLTGYDNSSGCRANPADQGPAPDPCPELYRYRVGDAGVTCISCNPTGAAPTASAAVQSMPTDSTGPSPAPSRTRNLSASGDRVFFESPDPLVVGDTNGVLDVYMWQAEGSGSCHSAAQNGGCLYLLSTGRSPFKSYFADASVSGDDAFFYTDSQLVPGDQGGEVDIYDARVGGGVAAQHQVVQSPCAGEGCKAPSTAPGSPTTAGSVSFDGAGNEGSSSKAVVSVSKLRAVTGSVARLRVRVSGAGRISISGASLKTVRRSVSRAATYTIAVRLSAKARKALKVKSKLKVGIKVAFTPRMGAVASKRLTLSFRQAQRAKKAALPGPSASKGGR